MRPLPLVLSLCLALTATGVVTAHAAPTGTDLVVGEHEGATDVRLALPSPLTGSAEVNVEVVAGTANGDDVVLDTRTLTVPAGATELVVPLTVLQDEADEPDQTVSLHFSGRTDAALPTGSRTVTVVDDDPLPIATALTTSVVEGSEGTTVVPFAVELDRASEREVRIDVEVLPLTATVGEDVEALSSTIVLSPGATIAQTQLRIIGDTTPEAHEQFLVLLEPGDPTSAATTALVRSDLVPFTIRNDDARATLVPGRASEAAGTGTVGVQLDRPLATGAELRYRTFTGTAGAGDFAPVTSGTVQVPAGSIDAVLPVSIFSDTADEPDEHLDVQLFGVSSGIQVANAFARLTILDDDGGVRVAALGSVVEGDPDVDEGGGPPTPTTTTHDLLVHLDQPAPPTGVTVEITTNGGTATPDDDYTPISGRQVTVPAFQTEATTPLEVVADLDLESDETIELDVSVVSGGVAANATTSVVTILDDEVDVTLGRAAVREGSPGDANELVVPLTLSRRTPRALTIDLAVGQDGDTAEVGVDLASPGGSVSVPEGTLLQSVVLTASGDLVDEADETVTVRLLDAEDEDGIRIVSPNGGESILVDDEAAPSAGLGDVDDVTEDGGVLMVPVTLDRSSDIATTVRVDVVAGTVTSNDLESNRRDVTIPAGATTGSAAFTVGSDAVDELDETVTFRLSPLANASIGRAVTRATIVDDDTDDPGGPTDPPTDPGGPTEPGSPTIEIDGGTTVESEAAVLLTAGSVADDEVVDWDFDGGTTATGRVVTHRWATSGVHEVVATVRGADRRATRTVTVVDSGLLARAAGGDRIATAVEASRAGWPDGGADVVLLARADAFPDALAGGPLAATLDAPLLLTTSDSLSPEVATELARLGATRAVLLGGPAALSGAVADELAGAGLEVDRIAGGDRFDTARQVATRVGTSTGEVVLALGTAEVSSRAWPDALSAGALAASPDRLPILLIAPSGVPEPTRAGIGELAATQALVIGGPVAVPDAVVAAITAEGVTVRRLAGGDRYATSAAVLTEAIGRYPAGQVELVLATGANFPDGLAAAAIAARRGGVVLLVPPTDLGDGATSQVLTATADRFDRGIVMGGPVAVSEGVESAAREAITD